MVAVTTSPIVKSSSRVIAMLNMGSKSLDGKPVGSGRQVLSSSVCDFN